MTAIPGIRGLLRLTRLHGFAGRIKRRITGEAAHPDQIVVSLERDGAIGRVLLSYIIEPFLLKPGQAISVAHTHDWESLQIAQTYLDLGFSVDVISYRNKAFIPDRDYTLMVDARWNMERLATHLAEKTVRLMHMDTSHLLFHNAAECRRLLELQQRRGVTLQPRRFEAPNLGLEHSDGATVLGNDSTIRTYQYAGKPLYKIPVSTTAVYPWAEESDIESCRTRFLWLGSGGMVHKGLDLALEAFAALPDFHLTVCGPVQVEKDFVRAYRRELYETPNIRTVGWTDVTAPEFAGITRNCIGMVYPSCSEGSAGCVVTCLHAGLIPVVSPESGIDTRDFGFVLERCTVPEIMDVVRGVASLPAAELRMRCRRAWEFARENHTRERFAREYQKATVEILRDHGGLRLAHPLRSTPVQQTNPMLACSTRFQKVQE